MYVPRIVYAYEADGHTFESDDLAGRPAATYVGRRKYVKRYKLHLRARVFYNPDDPLATLSPSLGVIPLILLLVSGGMAIAAAAVGWLIP